MTLFDGVLVIDKPAGPTSHDVVARVRRAIGERQIGHCGTLDPAASGVLVLVIGRATRLARFLSASDKAYRAVVRVGIATDTYDAEGLPVASAATGLTGAPIDACGPLEVDRIEAALERFRGTFAQRPPPYSAKKVDGIRAYRLARQQAPVALTPVSVTVRDLRLVSVEGHDLTIDLVCSAGFYVRVLAHELGRALGPGAHLAALRRTRSGALDLARAVSLDLVERDPVAAHAALVPTDALLPELPAVVLTAQGEQRVGHGRDLGPEDLTGPPPPPTAPWVRLLDAGGRLRALAEPVANRGFLHPSLVLG